MRIAESYALPDGWYLEFCTLDEAQKGSCVYPDVGCIHQGYTAAGATSEAGARQAVEAKARTFLDGELVRNIPMWRAAERNLERKIRADARRRALEERIMAEERARLAAATPPRVP